jgi:hypothetical protein
MPANMAPATVLATVLTKKGQIPDRKFLSAGLFLIAKPDAVAS